MSERMPVLKEPKPKRRGGRRLLVVLYLLFIALLVVLFFRSPLSKISEIAVSGGRFADVEQIRTAAGIAEGDPFFYPTAGMIAERVERLESVKEAVVRKTFPGDVYIEVTEYPAVAYSLTNDGGITAILSNGTELAVNTDAVVDRPVLRGWEGREDKLRLIEALAGLPEDLLADFSEIAPFPSDAYPDRIRIYTRTRFEIVTAVSLIADKADTIRAVIETQEPGSMTLLLADRYVPYLEDSGSEGEDDARGSE